MQCIGGLTICTIRGKTAMFKVVFYWGRFSEIVWADSRLSVGLYQVWFLAIMKRICVIQVEKATKSPGSYVDTYDFNINANNIFGKKNKTLKAIRTLS